MTTPSCYHFDRLSQEDIITCGTALRRLGQGAVSMEMVANRLVHYFYRNFRNAATGQPALALVRCFKTESYTTFQDPRLQASAQAALGKQPLRDDLPFLTLLATAGSQPEWNDRHQSRGHQAIPLASKEAIEQAPMISRLIQQLGLGIDAILDPQLMVSLKQQAFNVFHVPDAIGSIYIPAQEEFVQPYGIRSVLGFGGILPSGHLFAFILFSTVPIPRSAADQFKSLALSVKLTLVPFDKGPIFSKTAFHETAEP